VVPLEIKIFHFNQRSSARDTI